MALINHAKREINAKLVYYGPGLSGKATNLNFIYRKLKPEYRGKLKSMNIQKDRMIFFDVTLPGQGSVEGYETRFHIYALVGEVTNSAAWKMVLKGADGVVFVADSAPERLAANRESLRVLEKILGAYGKGLTGLPGVLQCNKRDLANPLPLAEMESALNAGRFPVVPAVAGKGEGVIDSLFTLVKSVLMNLREGGVELAGGELAGLAVAAPAAGEEEPAAASGQFPAAAEEEPPAAPGGGEAPPAAMPAAQSASAVEEPVLALAGEAEPLAGGRLRLPLSIRYAGREKKVAITVAVSVELDEAE